MTVKEKKLIKIKSIQFCAADATTDVNVDYLRMSKIADVNYGPFGRETANMLDSFEAFMNCICGTTTSSATNASTTMAITQVQRLNIALEFYKSRTFEYFKFKASHKVYKDFACMVVQKKYFYLYTNCENDACVKEINENDYRRGKVMGKHVVAVHELAFDQEAMEVVPANNQCISKPTPALWFGIPDCDIQVATVKEITDIAKTEKLQSKQKGGTKNSFLRAYWSHSTNPVPPFKMIYARLNDPSGVHYLIMDVLMYQANKLRGNYNSHDLILLQHRFKGAKQSIGWDMWPACEESMIDSSSHSTGTYDPAPGTSADKIESCGTITTARTRISTRTSYGDSVPTAERSYNLSKMSNKYFLFQSLCCNIGKGIDVRDNYITTNGRPRLSTFVKIHLTGVASAEQGGNHQHQENE